MRNIAKKYNKRISHKEAFRVKVIVKRAIRFLIAYYGPVIIPILRFCSSSSSLLHYSLSSMSQPRAKNRPSQTSSWQTSTFRLGDFLHRRLVSSGVQWLSSTHPRGWPRGGFVRENAAGALCRLIIRDTSGCAPPHFGLFLLDRKYNAMCLCMYALGRE